MKKTVVLISALFLSATLSFGQTPQTQDKTKTDNKSECPMKKDGKDCSMDKKDGKSCCTHSGASKPSDTKQGTDVKKTDAKPDKK
ncbi:MAG TPA: hypothetical protein VMC08_00045 [Bacteroidales bacterium]|nr:hypothetical protein [Bacteroidales bacterium]